MNRRDRAFNRHTNAPAPPRLDADRLVRRPLGWLTPNHVVAACRVFLAILAMVALIAGPDGLGSIVLRFAVAYGVTILAMPAFPRVSGSILGGALALLFGARWAFSTLNSATVALLLPQLAGVACALAPVYARNVGGLAGSIEGHISFTERRAMWRRRRSAAPAASSRLPPQPSQAPGVPAVALLDYRPEITG